MTARCLPCYLFIIAILGAGLTERPAAAQRGRETVLVLGIQHAGKYDPKVTHALYDHLAKAGEALAKESALAAPERLCGNEECMSLLASREEAKIVLGGQVQDSSPTSHYVTVTLFDVDRRVPTDEKTICDHCSAAQLQAAVWDLADRLLRGYRLRSAAAQGAPKVSTSGPPTAMGLPAGPSGVAAPVLSSETSAPGAEPSRETAPPKVAASPPPTSSSGDLASRWSPKRKIAAGILTGLLIAALIPSFALAATDGQTTTVIGCSSPVQLCVLQNKPLYAAGFALSGALAIGVGITLLWPSGKPVGSSPPSQPSQSSIAALEAN